MRRFSFGLVACSLPAFLLSLALTGCGGGDSKEKAGSDSKEKEKDKATSKVEPLEGGTGVIKGKVTLKVNDDVKKVLALDYMAKMKSASLKADDVAVCTKGDMSQQSWKVDDKGGVANVFVWVTPPKDKFFAVDAAIVLLFPTSPGSCRASRIRKANRRKQSNNSSSRIALQSVTIPSGATAVASIRART